MSEPTRPPALSGTLPPDRGQIATELRNPRSQHLHTTTVEQCVSLILDEDAAVLEALRKAQPALIGLIQAAEHGFMQDGRLIYLGAGTSGRLGVLDASEAPPTFQVEPGKVIGLIAGGDSALRKSSEHMEDRLDGAQVELEALRLTNHDTVIGIAAGGTTPYVRGGLGHAKRLAPGCTTGLLTCSRVELPPGCDRLILLETGPEVLTGSTRMKAGTATKLALNTISTTLMVRSGRVFENLMVDLRATNDKLRDRAARIVATLTQLDRAAALAAVDAAQGDVKAAIVMHRLGLDLANARAKLASVSGRLHLALDTPVESSP